MDLKKTARLVENRIENLWPDGPQLQQAPHAKLTTDTVLLADFISLRGVKRGIDLGCASGALMILLLAKGEKLSMTGIELFPEAARMAEENMRLNGWEDRSDIRTGDLRDVRTVFPAGAFDLVAANPPYFRQNSGKLAPDIGRAAARAETACTMEDMVEAAAYLCRSGGKICFVQKPERLSELCVLMAAQKLEPKRLRFVCYQEGKKPSLILLEGRKDGNPGLAVEPVLVLKNSDGTDSPEYKRIYHAE